MTKKIAILGSGQGKVFESIVNYLKNKDIEITCLSNNLKSELFKTAQDLNIKHKYLPEEENTQYFASENFDLVVLTDYDEKFDNDTLEVGKFINIHPSLLPSFKGEDAIQRAYLAGVKVTGVTVHWLKENVEEETIIAQYPVLIGITTHLDEVEKDIYDVEKKLYPPVIDAILNDRVFDFQDLFKSSCHANSSCGGGCSKCHN